MTLQPQMLDMAEKARRRQRRVPQFIRLAGDDAGAPLHERLYQRIRELILSGTLESGSRLAPSRSLADSLGISRNSVLTAIDRLVADGWLESRHGSGVFVAYTGPRLARNGSPATQALPAVPFALGVPPVDIFPAALWRRLQSRRWQRMSAEALHEGEATGWSGLREAIAAHAALTRGLNCSADEVIVTSCVAAGVDLAIRSLGLSDTDAWVENPGFMRLWATLQNCGVRLVPVRVEKSGLDVEEGRRFGPHARLALVTPSCQFPTGVTMSRARRRALVEWAHDMSGWIFEDDFDWYNAATPSPPRPLAAMDRSRTIYFNTFNHMLFPALRIAYIIVPPNLVDRFAAVRKSLDGSANVPNQMVMADFINGGHLDDHLKRLRACDEERRRALLQEIGNGLCDYLTPHDNRAGSYVTCTLTGLTLPDLLAASQSEGIVIEPMSEFRLVPEENQQIVMGYGGFRPASIAGAAARLRDVMDSVAA